MTDCTSNDSDIIEQNRLMFLTNRAETIQEIAARSVFRNNMQAMPDCLDPTDQTQVSKRNFLQSDRPIVSNGTYNINAVDSLVNDFKSNLTIGIGVSNIINKAVENYGESFYSSLDNLNRFLNRADLTEYSALSDRVGNVPITPIEYAEFLNEFIYTPAVINTNITLSPTFLLTQLDQFYVRNFTQSAIGGFCALMPQVFNAVGKFFTLVGFLSQGINGIIAALRERAIQELMRKIAEEVSKIIDRTIGKVLGIIVNFSIENFFGDIETFINEQIVGRIVSLKEDILTFFTRENIQRIKKRVEDLITYAVSVFQNPSLEEIQFLVYRFCSFASQIENIINGLKDPLSFFASNYRSTIQRIRSASNVNTALAVAAGAIRISDGTRSTLINTGEDTFNEASGGVLQPTLADYAAIPTWDEVSNGRSSAFRINYDRSQFQEYHEGWTELDHERFLPMLVRLQREVGTTFVINSGYRNAALNESVGGVRTSLHLNGFAVDIDANTLTLRNRIRDAALRIGFDEVIRYPEDNPNGSFVHVGLRAGHPASGIARVNRRNFDIAVNDARRRGTLYVPI